MSGLERVSSHIEETRWFQRSDDPVMSPVDAWMDGDQIHVHDLEADEVRYHRHTGTVLLRRNRTLVTVLDENNLRPTTRAVVESRRDQL